MSAFLHHSFCILQFFLIHHSSCILYFLFSIQYSSVYSICSSLSSVFLCILYTATLIPESSLLILHFSPAFFVIQFAFFALYFILRFSVTFFSLLSSFLLSLHFSVLIPLLCCILILLSSFFILYLYFFPNSSCTLHFFIIHPVFYIFNSPASILQSTVFVLHYLHFFPSFFTLQP